MAERVVPAPMSKYRSCLTICDNSEMPKVEIDFSGNSLNLVQPPTTRMPLLFFI